MGIILGLTAALCWGGADFMARYCTRAIGTYRTLLYIQIFGFVGLGVWLWQSGEGERVYQRSQWQDWAWAGVAAVLNVVSSLALYRAFQVGVLSVVSPIGSSYSALTTVLAVLSGEILSATRVLGIGAAILGVILASISRPEAIDPNNKFLTKRRGLPPGIVSALIAALCFGFTFWTLGFQVAPHLGGVFPIWFSRMGALGLLVVLALPARQNIKFPTGRIWWLIAGVGILDTAAFVSNTLGLTTDQVSVVTVLASLFSAVTVILARLFLHERLQRSQWLGILLIFVGIFLVSTKG